ncbi:serine hydrolase domain-containing protein [Serpentinicella alkaliphila]|uniref:CubicO group peptidase (Beta-lactamase class C family) n=1 Tax=Serpentinicella alkaliphila TaxID=1734049 RepID=A0A4V2T4Y5_9FIRM|nr:serine hydrolase domain-containing protein [Serpentinicella alkaliphila]QUH25225.1 beta-lactamase family protein [Serpentinicella alkaliphila]TCQ07034.1 CubicO group peptidase (beta-lactamase class C family) [Serpentinicella alkaliphila]
MKRKFLSLLFISFFIIHTIISTLFTPVFALNLNLFEEKTPSGIPFNKMEKVIDEYVSKYIGKTTPGAAIAIVKNGEIVFLKGYGYADLENQIPVDPKLTVFEWASTSKLFTWTSVMQLVESGKLDLDADIKTYLLPEFAEKLNYNQTITMRDIMNHSAGFGNYAFNTIVLSPDKLVSLEEALLRDKPKQYYKVGTASAYSNYSTSLAGYIVQNISQQPFEAYIRENIFNVLSMNNTSSHPTLGDNSKIIEKKAQGYIPSQKGGFKLGNWSYVSHLPAGSINGTAEDFARYAIALTPDFREKSPLFKDTNTLITMLSPSYDINGEMVGTSHGFFEYVGNYRTLGHGGNTAAFSSQFAVVPEERFGIVILTNAYLEMNILFGLQDLLLGKDYSDIKVPNEELPSSKKVTGRYIPVDRQEGNFVAFTEYFNLYTVKATDQNTIMMNIGPYNGTYLQTKPYYYELIDDNIPFFRNMYHVIRFKIENDAVKHVFVGNGVDLSPLPTGRTMPFLISSLIILLVNILFFIIAPAVLIITIIKDKNKGFHQGNKRFNLYFLVLVLLGLVTLTNNLIPTYKIMISSFRTFAEMKPHILLNFPLLIATITVAVLSFISVRKASISRGFKALYLISIVLLISLFSLLFHWNYFFVVG